MSVFVVVLCSPVALAQSPSDTVDLDGDVLEYSVDGNVVTAQGNVVISNGEATLKCDRVEFYRDSQMAYAEGNVRLISNEGEITGSKLNFNFETMQGDFHNARIYAKPYYGYGRKISRVGPNKMVMTDGYVTTSDFDKPEYRITSEKIEVFPGDKMIAYRSKVRFGDTPVMYIPKFTRSLKNRRPKFQFTPGYDNDWGAFLLTKYRHYFNDDLSAMLRLDYRDRKGIGTGLDVDYKTQDYGEGIAKIYYTQERNIQSDFSFEDKPSPTTERERFKAEWRHRWEVDDRTNAIWQYYKLSDETFLKDFFPREHDEDSNPSTFFLLTRGLPKGVLSFRTDKRVNRFESRTERLPEVRYDLSSAEIAETGLFFKNTTSFVNLIRKNAAPNNVHPTTVRLDADSELSYPMKVGFIEFKPYVGKRYTYYSKTIDDEDDGTIRGLFQTGASLSTKFYRIFDVEMDKWGMKFDRMRHIITPSIDYNFTNEPSVSNAELHQFDSIDAVERNHSITFSLENKLQTKRNGRSSDLLRAVISAPFSLKEDPSRQGFSSLGFDLDFRPSSWLSFYFDSSYDIRDDQLDTANFDLYINGKDDKWKFGIGKRFNRAADDDQITTEFVYNINQKWSLRMLDRLDVRNGEYKEGEYKLRRDLHSWYVDFMFNNTDGGGEEFLVEFTLKAFPDISVDAGTTFNKPERGSQIKN